MTSIVSCDCGASVRLPAKMANRSFRCPKCKAGIALTINAKVLSSSQLGAGDLGATCPICQTGISAEEVVITCPQCVQVHHRECWAEVGGCGTYGCGEAPSLEKEDATAAAPRSGWGDDKACPACGETIKSIALRCRYCGEEFDTVDPLTVRDLRRQASTEDASTALRKTAIALFAVSLIGCFAPLVALIGLIVLLPKHRQLVRTGQVYVVLGYASIGLSVIYSVLMLLFAIF